MPCNRSRPLAATLLAMLAIAAGLEPGAARAGAPWRDMFGHWQGLPAESAHKEQPPALFSLADDFQAPEPVSELNTSDNEADPFLFHDQLTLYFSSDRPGGFGGYDIWMATRPDRVSPFGTPVNLGAAINTATNEISPNVDEGKHLIFFVRSDGTLESNDIYSSYDEAGEWVAARPVSALNLASSESYPFFSDYFGGNHIYFTTDRPGGAGQDIWHAHAQQGDGISFDAPVRLPNLNTAADELCFRMAYDARNAFLTRLPLASGDADVLFTTRTSPAADFQTTSPVAAIQSSSFESAPSVSDDLLELFFFSPNRPGGSGGADIWRSLSGLLPTPTPTPYPDVDLAQTPGEEGAPVTRIYHDLAPTTTSAFTTSAIGDFNDDGYADLVLTSERASALVGAGTGDATIIYGGPELPAEIHIGVEPGEGQTRFSSGPEPNQIQPLPGQHLGISAAVADLTGDGVDDLLLGCLGETAFLSSYPAEFDQTPWMNRYYIIEGGAGLVGTTRTLAVDQTVGGQTQIITSLPSYNLANSATGDFDGDGHADLAIGAPTSAIFFLPDWYKHAQAELIVLYGPFPGGETIDLRDPVGTHGEVRYTTINRFIGENMITGDFNGDGYDDIVCDGVPDPAIATSPAVIWGGPRPSAGEISINFEDPPIPNGVTSLYFDETIRPFRVGDYDADGFADLGGTRGIFGRSLQVKPADFGANDDNLLDNDIGFVLRNNSALYPWFVGATDMDADGRSDVALFDSSSADPGFGRVMVYLSDESLPGREITANTTLHDLRILGAELNDRFGGGGAPDADYDGDGLPDLAVIARGWDGGRTPEAAIPGYAAIIFGHIDATSATATLRSISGPAPLRPVGGPTSPVMRAWIGFDSGDDGAGGPSRTTETLYRSKALIANLEDEEVGTAADVLWHFETDREDFTTATLRLRYTGAEVEGLAETTLSLYQAADPAGPWSLVPGAVVNPDNSTVTAEVASLGWFALASPDIGMEFRRGSGAWFGGAILGTGAVKKGFAGVCMDSPLLGDNVAGWVSQDAYLPLVDEAVIKLTFELTTNQTEADAIPFMDLTYDNFPANLYGGQGFFLDGTGGANGIGRPQGRSEFQLWASPSAALTPQWRGTLANGVPGENDESPFNPDYDAANDMRLVVRALDVGSAGISANADWGLVCVQRVTARRLRIGDIVPDGFAWAPAINNLTHGAETLGQMGGGSAVIDDEAAEARFQLTSAGVGSRKTLFPWDHAVDAVAPFHPIPWQADALYRGTVFIRSLVDGGEGRAEGTDPVDLIGIICDSATNEVGQLHFTLRGNAANMHLAGSPRLAANTGGSPQRYVGFFHSHNATALDQIAFPGSSRLRLMGDLLNVAEIAPDGFGADPVAISAMGMERVAAP